MNRPVLFVACVGLFASALALGAAAQYPGWQHSGSIFILTTPEGADLPASATERDFPLLVRLHQDFFDFSQAKSQGEDLRFSASAGAPLAYQIEEWDGARGVASLWVRLPVIRGNARQEIRLHWGNADAASESSGAAVFNLSNGYLSVWHMSDPVTDEVGTLASADVGTGPTVGTIGLARHLAGRQGVFGGEAITNYPSGASAHSTEAWFRPERPNGTILGWGREQAQGKVVMQFRSPPHVSMDCYFSDANVASRSAMRMSEWAHAVHTYDGTEARLYINGVLEGTNRVRGSPLNLGSPARLWLGGWYDDYSFVGDLDEVRISRVARSADWVRLEYENQKPLQTLVGPVVQQGDELSVSPSRLTVLEGHTAAVTAHAGGARKIYWILKRGGRESVVAVDRFSFTFDAGRVTGDQLATLQFKAIYADAVKTKDIAITIKEDIQEPAFTLTAPAKWDGRETIEVAPVISNLAAMKAKGAGELKPAWSVSGLATIKEVAPDRLILKRAQNSGQLRVTLSLSNGGTATAHTTTIIVREPKQDAWVQRMPADDEKPEDNQFYARDDKNEGTLFCNGALAEPADSVFLRVYADDTLLTTQTQKPNADRTYALSAKLKPGLIKYRIESGARTAGHETVQHTATNLVCGDAYLIDGQSNALATDTDEKAPAETHEWIRSYGGPQGDGQGEHVNLWCHPVWRARQGEKAELGYWGMELAKRLVERQSIPIFIVNGAVGGTRIDQHQRNPANPEDISTIYGRLLWRVHRAKLTHGIRGILWHQGENDQGADGPTGGYGWETYQQYFIEMSGGWKQDYPNVQHYYLFQIWPKACAMGVDGSDNMLREVQRTLPSLYSRMSIMSTLGIKPPGDCHYPLAGWAEFARLIQPLIERDHYGRVCSQRITPPNLVGAAYTSDQKEAIALEFDQSVVWTDALAGQFYLDGERGKVASGSVTGDVLTLKLAAPSTAQHITYLDSQTWNPDHLLYGVNGIAALTFCDVQVQEPP
ncbi:MAG TPA: DUF2341 domain-containing protein [Verrucomicrobiota bacterium]|nr:DUF2341 domain-containing protein [Verrucomicrobiota bacterium]